MLLLTVLIFSLLMVLITAGQWVGLAFGTASLIIGYFAIGPKFLEILTLRAFGALNLSMLCAIPLFTFMGILVRETGLAKKVYSGLSPWVEVFPGRLLHSNVLAGMVFAAACGSSVASAATLGSMAIPDQKARGYDIKMSLGSLAASGVLAIIIPPSIAMIVYGTFVGESVPQLFIAGIIPGLMVSFLFMTYIGLVCWFRPDLAPSFTQERLRLKRKLLGLIEVAPFILIIVVVLGGIYMGVVTPSEAAAAGALASLVLCLLYRRLTPIVLKDSLVSTMIVTCMVLLIYMGAQIFCVTLGYLGILQYITSALLSLHLGPLGSFIVIAIIYLILGCLMDSLSLLLLTIGITYPVMMNLGFDGIWFGVVVVLLAETGLITPPIGVNLFVIQSISGCTFSKVAIGALPYVVILLMSLVIIYAFPQVVLWLPSLMR